MYTRSYTSRTLSYYVAAFYVFYMNPTQAPIVPEIFSFPQEFRPSLVYTNSMMYSQNELTNDLPQ